MTVISRRERLREETIREILETASIQMANKGSSSLSIRAIAREMGMTAPAIYRYFKNRNALVTALIGEAFKSLQIALAKSQKTHQEKDFKTQLLEVGVTYRNWGLKNPSKYSLIFGTPIPSYHAPAEIIGPIAKGSLLVLINILRNGVAVGEFKIPAKLVIISKTAAESFGIELGEFTPTIQLAVSFWGYIHGITSLELYGHLFPFLQDVSDFFETELEDKICNILIKD